MRLRARTLSGIPGGFLYAPRKMLRAEARGHNSQLALLRQVSPGLQRIFQRASSLHPGGPCPESHRRCVLAGVRDEGKVVVGERRWRRKLDDARGRLGAAASRGCGSRIVKLWFDFWG